METGIKQTAQENADYLKKILQELKKELPYKWRVQSYSKKKPQATVMAYIDARDCMDMLNEHATYGWHREHYVVEGNVYCKVGLVMPDGSVQWRSDCGVESQADAEKGQSSDSFKRACVNLGIGGFLYKLGVEYITASEVKTQTNYPYPVDEQGKQIWDLTKHINAKNKKTETPKTNTPPPPPPAELPWISSATKDQRLMLVEYLAEGKSMDNIKKKYKLRPEDEKAMLAEVVAYKKQKADLLVKN